MTWELQYGVNDQTIPLGIALDSTDGNTPVTDLTINASDILICKNGAALVAKNSGGATHDTGGIYLCTLDSVDCNTYGPIKIFCHVDGALVLAFEGAVVNPTYWSKKYSGTTYNDIAATAIVSDGAITTSGGIADVNIRKVNSVTVNGDGSATPMGV